MDFLENGFYAGQSDVCVGIGFVGDSVFDLFIRGPSEERICSPIAHESHTLW